MALQNAASVAGLLITTEAMVADRPKKDAGPAACRAAAAWAAWATWTSKPVIPRQRGRQAEARAGDPSCSVVENVKGPVETPGVKRNNNDFTPSDQKWFGGVFI